MADALEKGPETELSLTSERLRADVLRERFQKGARCRRYSRVTVQVKVVVVVDEAA
jgi:hypothetical protein